MVDRSADRPPIRMPQAPITYPYPIDGPCAPTFALFPMWVKKDEPAHALEDVLLDRQVGRGSTPTIQYIPFMWLLLLQSRSGLALHCATLVCFLLDDFSRASSASVCTGPFWETSPSQISSPPQ